MQTETGTQAQNILGMRASCQSSGIQPHRGQQVSTSQGMHR